MKITKIIVIGICSLLFLTIIIINKLFYANVINLNVVIVIITSFFLIVSFIQNKNKLITSFILAVISLLFVMFLSFPKYNYSQASELVSNNYPGNLLDVPDKNFAIYYKGFNVFEPSRHYRVVLEVNGEEYVYVVSPNTGKITQQ